MRNQTKLKANVMAHRKRTKLKLVEYKGGGCEICGYNKCIQALEFHHIDETTKEFSVSGSTKSLERQKKEADKCLLLMHTHIVDENGTDLAAVAREMIPEYNVLFSDKKLILIK